MYDGGKNGEGVYHTIINHFPPHKSYIECYLGSGAILRNKKRAPLFNIGIEINPATLKKFTYPDYAHVVQLDVFDFLHDFRFYEPTTLAYFDPPYPRSSRRDKKNKLYKYEMTDQQHEKLLKAIKLFTCMVAISSYKNDLYEKHLKGWHSIEFNAQTRKGTAKEILYMNYPPPLELQDYNHLGKDFTERQRIKRKINRHVQRLLSLPPLERAAIIHSIKNKF